MKSIGSKSLGELFLVGSLVLFLNLGYTQVADAAPTANFATSTALGVRPLSVTFTDTSTGGASVWKWTLGDGTESSNPNPNHSYKTAGIYRVTLTVKDSTGNESLPFSQTITVTGAKFTTASGANSLHVLFKDTSVGPPIPTIWTWDFGDASPTDSTQHPTHTYAKGGTYSVTLTVNSPAGTPNSVTNTITVADPLPKIPDSANLEWMNLCVDKSLNLSGDFQKSESAFFVADGQWSVGPAVSTQLIKYDFGKKKAGVNTAVGPGASFRFYQPIEIKDGSGNPVAKVPISQVKTRCRYTSYGISDSHLAASLFSITPTIYLSEPVDQNDLSVQPALLLGFFSDILNIGVGFNLTGPSGEKGNVFMLMSIGTGFKF